MQRTQRWARLAALLVGLAVVGATHQHMDTASKADRGDAFVPSPQQARISALGFDALAADRYWLQAVQVLGGERAGIGDHARLISDLIDVVTTLDPWVGYAYRFAAVWLTETPEDVLRANRLLERAIAYAPHDWRNRHYLGFNHFYYLGDNERGADILEAAVGLPRAPAYLGGLVAKLRMDRDGLETAATFLSQLAASTNDEFVQAEYLKALDEIDTERRARFLDRAREEYRKRSGQDITRVEDLLLSATPVLRGLPPAHPHLHGFRWELDPETGEIVSEFYGARYAPYVHHADRERRERWKHQVDAQRERT